MQSHSVLTAPFWRFLHLNTLFASFRLIVLKVSELPNGILFTCLPYADTCSIFTTQVKSLFLHKITSMLSTQAPSFMDVW